MRVATFHELPDNSSISYCSHFRLSQYESTAALASMRVVPFFKLPDNPCISTCSHFLCHITEVLLRWAP